MTDKPASVTVAPRLDLQVLELLISLVAHTLSIDNKIGDMVFIFNTILEAQEHEH